MSVDPSARTVDTRGARRLPPARYRKMRWVPGHGEALPESFDLSADAALERYLAAEREHPELVPAGFRQRWSEASRDPGLRLEMAKCELSQPTTRRRASYDAVVALLLGAKPESAEPIIMESTRNAAGSNTVSSCEEQDDCGADEVCDEIAGWCLTPMALASTHVAPNEVEMEDALGRAVSTLYRARHGAEAVQGDALYWWGERRVHRCGDALGRLCGTRAYAKGGGTRLVRWDLRDGGTIEVERRKLTATEQRILDMKIACWEKTGAHTRGQCETTCRAYQRGPQCDVDCQIACAY